MSATSWLRRLRAVAHRGYYLPLISFLAGVDLFITVVPTDPILVSSVLLNPRRWSRIALGMSVGSVLGVLLLASLVAWDREGILNHWFPHLRSSATWARATELFQSYGLVAIAIVAATPLPQQPLVILSSFSGVEPPLVALLYLLGRLPKFALLAWLTSRAPRLLLRLPFLGRELRDFLAEEINRGPPATPADTPRNPR